MIIGAHGTGDLTNTMVINSTLLGYKTEYVSGLFEVEIGRTDIS